MRKLFIILLSVLLIFTFCACSSESEMSELEKQYYDYAQECIEKGETDKAIESLEEGITNTGSEELQKLLDEVKKSSDENVSKDETSQNISSTVSVAPQSFDITNYIGWWQETEDVYTTGGIWLDIYDDGGTYLNFMIALAQSGGYREAGTEFVILKENIKNNIIESTFTDSFGNKGFASIEFLENKVICTISDLQEPYDGADWGIYNGDYVLKYHGTEH